MRSVFITILFGLQAISSLAFQKADNIVASINKEPILADEFMYAFNKNRKSEGVIHYDSLEKYLNQYIDFKLKVLLAKKRGIDTTQAFVQEYKGYISQVQKPYLQNSTTEESLIKEAYERLKEEIHAAHILIKINNDANPEDTLKAYQKIDSLRQLAISGSPFDQLAKENSSDGSARNGGDLGWFTSMAMVYPFENGAYKTEVGGISEIVRSQFGYHIIKVFAKRPTKGKVKTSHIFLTKNGRSIESGNQLMQAIYDSLHNGGNWKELVKKYSEDSRTKLNSGGLPLAGTGELPEEYLNIAYNLEKPGDVSKPTETSYGWHIVKLDQKQEMPSFEDLKPSISERIRRSGRNQLDMDEVVKKLKVESQFQQDFAKLKKIVSDIEQMGLPNVESPALAKEEIFRIGSKSVSYEGYFKDLGNANQLNATALWNRYKTFEREQLLAYAEELAPKKYPEYGFLLNEYKEGLMFFAVMETEVWNKGAADEAGQENFFEANKSKYQAPERAEVWVIECNNSALLTSILENSEWAQQQPFLEAVVDKLPDKERKELKIAKRTFVQDDLPNFAQNWRQTQLFGNPSEGRIYAMEKILAAGTYDLDEIRGMVISDYQDYLDKEWIKSLRKQNKIFINKKVLKQLASDEEK